MPRQRKSGIAADPSGTALLFAALGDESRLRLVLRLCDGPLSITDLTAGSHISRQAVTKHLRAMEEAGLLRSYRRGRQSIWQLEKRRLADAKRYLDQISREWDASLGRLRDLVENP